VAAAPRIDATVAVAPRIDAAVAVAPVDAAVVTVRPDAAPRPDAAVVAVARDAGTVTATDDKTKEAKQLYDKAHEALEEGDPEQALQLLDQSLKLRKTARSFLERARALQRLNRIDDAVAAVDEAIKMNSSYAPAYEQKGMILWSAQRYAEARPVLQKYLELDPNGRRAAVIRGMLDEPK
jgi:tetratricopeptide (TPR) repeat protein